MKLTIALLALLALMPTRTRAQEEQHDLKTLLQDAGYVFNRFDETTTGLDSQIDDWNIPTSSKALFKRELRMVSTNVTGEKPRLNALLRTDKLSSTDLFDVYSELVEISGELFGQASNFANWGDNPSKALELAQLGAKANTLSGNLGVVLRQRINAQENSLDACLSKPHPSKQE